ncbi:MAG TPA: hypothetical protein VGC56_00655 [Allosphingosinicella sp.]|jgi:hypothetical protein
MIDAATIRSTILDCLAATFPRPAGCQDLWDIPFEDMGIDSVTLLGFFLLIETGLGIEWAALADLDVSSPAVMAASLEHVLRSRLPQA